MIKILKRERKTPPVAPSLERMHPEHDAHAYILDHIQREDEVREKLQYKEKQQQEQQKM